MKTTSMLLVAALACLVGCNQKGAPSGGASEIASGPIASGATAAAAGDEWVGKPAPPLRATAHDGQAVDVAALQGKPVVVYFYPKDETPGCTKEACAFRDHWDELSKYGVVLIGVSADSDESHRKFAEHHKLPFLLVSDADGSIAKAFGVPVRLGMTQRQTFVIGADGRVKKVYRTVNVAEHAREILADVQAEVGTKAGTNAGN